MRAHTLAPCLGLLFTACGSEPPPAPNLAMPVAPEHQPTGAASAEIAAPLASAAAAASAKPTVAVGLTALAVPLDGARAEFDATQVDRALHDLEPAMRACIRGPKDQGRAWFVARVDSTGAVTAKQILASRLPDATTQCVATVFDSAEIAPPNVPLAISLVATFDPPLGSKSATDADKEPASSFGTLWGGEAGDAFGTGGIGLSGVGHGGGTGIGIGSIGAIGHGSGTGAAQGFGNGEGRLGGSHRSKPPKLASGAAGISGRLPPEVIQRIVRQSFGRFQACYQDGLRSDPSLEGKVVVRFTIEKDGSASSAERETSTTLPDNQVVSCVTKVFGGLSYPAPEGGKVTVTYPLLFSLGDDEPAGGKAGPHPAPKKPVPKAIRVGGKSLDALVGADIVRAVSPQPNRKSPQTTPSSGPNAAVITLDDKPGSPFVVFVEYQSEVLAIERVKAPKQGERAPSGTGGLIVFERVDTPPHRHALRAIGRNEARAGELLDWIIE